MTRRSGRGVHPLIVLVAIGLVPTIVLFAIWRWADGAARGADPAPRTSVNEPAAPAPALSTPLLSYRRTPGVLARDLSLDDFADAVAEFGSTLNETSCVAVELDGVPVGCDPSRRSADPGQQPEAARRRGRPRRARSPPPLHHRGPGRASPMASPATCTWSAEGTRCSPATPIPWRTTSTRSIEPDLARRARRRRGRGRRAAGRGRGGRGRQPLRRRVVRAQLVRRPAGDRGAGRTTPCSSTTPA